MAGWAFVWQHGRRPIIIRVVSGAHLQERQSETATTGATVCGGNRLRILRLRQIIHFATWFRSCALGLARAGRAMSGGLMLKDR
jgi:hypothetical protein